MSGLAGEGAVEGPEGVDLHLATPTPTTAPATTATKSQSAFTPTP
jgi:hypothetical protein